MARRRNKTLSVLSPDRHISREINAEVSAPFSFSVNSNSLKLNAANSLGDQGRGVEKWRTVHLNASLNFIKADIEFQVKQNVEMNLNLPTARRSKKSFNKTSAGDQNTSAVLKVFWVCDLTCVVGLEPVWCHGWYVNWERGDSGPNP